MEYVKHMKNKQSSKRISHVPITKLQESSTFSHSSSISLITSFIFLSCSFPWKNSLNSDSKNIVGFLLFCFNSISQLGSGQPSGAQNWMNPIGHCWCTWDTEHQAMKESRSRATFSKCRPWIGSNSSSSTWERGRNENSLTQHRFPELQSLEVGPRNLYFNMLSWWFYCTLQFDNPCSTG